MSDSLEVVFVSDDKGSVQCLDPRIGTVFVNYRGTTGIQYGCMSIVSSCYLLAAEAVKPIVHVWPLNSQEPLPGSKLILPGRPSAVACSPDGVHCVISIETKLYIYQTTSGALLGVIAKHYRGISKLLFLSDSAHFVSCGDNGGVLVWRLSTAVSREGATVIDTTGAQEPVYSFSHHALRVTDVYASPAAMSGRLFTASIDQTANVYDLRNGALLLSITFDDSITTIVPNIIETALYVGTAKGDILEYRLDPLPRTLHHTVHESDISAKFKVHEKAVSSIKISQDNHTLLTASADGRLIVWDIPGRQQIKEFNFKGPITNAILAMANDSMFREPTSPKAIFRNFERISSSDGSYEVSVLVNEPLNIIDYSEKTDGEVLIQQGNSSEEVDRLKISLSEAAMKNKELFQFAMEKILKSPYSFDEDKLAKRQKTQNS